MNVWTIKKYGEWDWTYANVELYRTEMWAYRTRKQLVEQNLYSFIEDYRSWVEANNIRVADVLLEAEKSEDHEYVDPDTWCNVYYDPHRMCYSCRNDDYSSYIEVLSLPIKD